MIIIITIRRRKKDNNKIGIYKKMTTSFVVSGLKNKKVVRSLNSFVSVSFFGVFQLKTQY